MKNLKKISLFLSVFSFCVVAFTGMNNSFAAVSIKQKVDFSSALKDGISGKEIKLSDFAGKVVILEWFNDGCPFVKKHYESNNMQTLQDKAQKLGMIWLSVSSSSAGKQGHLADQAAVKKIVGDWKMNSNHMVLDHDGKLGKYFGAKVTPHIFILNEKSEVVYMGGIDSIKSADKADVNSPKVVKYVELAIDALGKKQTIAQAVTNEYGCGVKYAE
jgi:hypothetical protein